MPCELCKDFGLSFTRGFSPEEFIIGEPDSKVWIIGLNPKTADRINVLASPEALHRYFDDGDDVYPYFRDIKKISPKLYNLLGKKNGVAHTDLVKCHSEIWPKGRAWKTIVHNCAPYLERQIRKYRPKVLFCNGMDTCAFVRKVLPPKDDHETYYVADVDGEAIVVVLSGFIGRIDNFAKRRLGKEIENLLGVP
jgi:hypothetical protein